MRTSLTLALTLLIFFAGRADAQDQYDVGLYFDPAGNIDFFSPTLNVPFTVNAVAFGLDGEVKAYELSINGLVGTPSFVIDTFLAGPAILNTGDPHGPNYIIGTGGCIEGEPSINLVSLTVLPIGFFAIDTAVCVGGTVPSSFGGPPGYAKCNDEIVAFGVAQSGMGMYPNGCMIINPSIVPNASISFGDIKTRFQ